MYVIVIFRYFHLLFVGYPLYYAIARGGSFRHQNFPVFEMSRSLVVGGLPLPKMVPSPPAIRKDFPDTWLCDMFSERCVSIVCSSQRKLPYQIIYLNACFKC